MDKRIILESNITKNTIYFILTILTFAISIKPVHCTGAGIADVSINNIASNIFTSEEGITYQVIDNTDECQVVSYNGDSRNIIIPDEYNGYPVTSIADNAFKDNESIRTVAVGNNVTSMGKGAFAFCTSLYQIIVPGQVEKFGKNIFYGCNESRFTIVTPKNSKAESFALKNSLLVTDTASTSLSASNIRNIEGAQDKIYVYSAPSKVKWKSSNPGIAKVNKYGKITALKKGTAKITAVTAGQTLKCSVKVLERNKKNCLKVIYSKYVKKEMTDYEKIYAAHAWLIQNVKYDKTLYKTGTVPAISHTAEGAFNRGIAVCDGYSKAFIIIMRHYGIKSRMVTGGAHAWNIVRIKNKWYHVDCTYDDPIVNGSFNNKNVYLDFFLKTDKEMRKTHVWDYSAFPKCNSKKVNKNYKTK